jgi:succinate dehydrogenase / fumarate reductase, cytochrome b subunit
MIKKYISSSVGRKQIVAVTGLMLVLYLVFHLCMNMLIFGGPELYNYFPDKAHETGLLLRFIEAGLAAVFFVHIGFTIKLVMANRKARAHRYEVTKSVGNRSLATRLMPYTGTILLVFLVVHIMDYAAAGHDANSVVNGIDLGLYGLVVNSYLNPIKSAFYVIAMFAVGFHLAHGIQSVFQSFGYHSEANTPVIQKVSTAIGLIFAVAFSSVPVYLYFTYCTACPVN